MHQGAVKAVAKSLFHFGWQQPLVVDRNSVILVGHTRYYAAKQLGFLLVPVLVASNLTLSQARAYRIADNKVSEASGWCKKRLGQELKALQATKSWSGFSEAELHLITTCLERPSVSISSGAKPISLFNGQMPSQVKNGVSDSNFGQAVSRPGDYWQLGKHGVLCASAIDLKNLQVLLRGSHADLIVTDPPYGIGYGHERRRGSTAPGALVKAHGPIQGDGLDHKKFSQLIAASLANALSVSRQDSPLYVCAHWRSMPLFISTLVKLGREISDCIVWDKRSIGLGHNHYRSQFELILYSAGKPWLGGRGQANLWPCQRLAAQHYQHPTQKPTALMKRMIINSSRPGALVLDVFGGSGTTLLACEETARCARIVEIEPRYVDVIIRRWQVKTGLVAKLLPSNEIYTDVARKRAVDEVRVESERA